MLEQIHSSEACSLYHMKNKGPVDCLVASTPGSRAIANDPRVMGVDYTRRLTTTCSHVLRDLSANGRISLEETGTVVFNILRGGLNFGLREALADAFGWNRHASSFISAQRARDEDAPEQWHIEESGYTKVYLPEKAHIVMGDVVATGTSLDHGINLLVREARGQGIGLRSLLFFTIGGPRALEILTAADALCRETFPGYEKTTLVFLEGCFTVPDAGTRLRIKIPGTDLVRLDAVMAPEFIASQYEDPAYPLQRCAIYDAGSRAFWSREYLDDLADYWNGVRSMAVAGVTFGELLAERFPILDRDRFGNVDLAALCDGQLDWMR